MSLFIPQLLIISALGLMVQTAPINSTKRSTEINPEIQSFYQCTRTIARVKCDAQ